MIKRVIAACPAVDYSDTDSLILEALTESERFNSNVVEQVTPSNLGNRLARC